VKAWTFFIKIRERLMATKLETKSNWHDSGDYLVPPGPYNQFTSGSSAGSVIDPLKEFPPTLTRRLHDLIDRGQLFWGRGFGEEGALSKTDKSGVFEFVTTAPFAVADEASLFISSHIKELDDQIDQEDIFPRGIGRALLLTLSIAARSLIFACTYSVIFMLCLVGTCMGVVPAYVYFCKPENEPFDAHPLPQNDKELTEL
jgi:hypothetical protein